MLSTPSASRLGPTSPSVTVTLSELSLALDKMDLTQSFSAAGLYHTILQLQSTPSVSDHRKAILQRESNNVAYLNNIVSNPITGSSVAKERPKSSGFPVPSREVVTLKPDDDYFTPERRAKRRKVLEMTKEAFRDRMLRIFTSVSLYSDPRP
jgi:hypothetical protein